MFPFTDGMREEMVKGMFPANTCSKLTIETVEKGDKYVSGKE